MIHMMKSIVAVSLLASISLCTASDEAVFNRVIAPEILPEGFVWKSVVPEDCPFEQSDLFSRVYFTGRFSDYKCGDTFYPCWASDGNLYSPWTDGNTSGMGSASGLGDKARTGNAVMIGDDPLKLDIKNTSRPQMASAKPYLGRYPAGSLVHNGIWYYSTYCLGESGQVKHKGFKYNWPNMGPVPGFRISKDYGKTWTPSPLSPENPLFPEPAEYLGPVKMGAPHFVDFGQDMKYSPDGKAYMLGMGALTDDPKPRPCIRPLTPGKFEMHTDCEEGFDHANLSWITADQVYLSRVTPSPETINNIKAYEFFAGHDKKGQAIWTRDFKKIKPLLDWNNNMGCVTATYVPGLKKYLMCVTDGWPTCTKMSSYILEADKITGPWKMITYMKNFGVQAYFLNFPSKFMSEDGKNMWLCYSANFARSWYGVTLDFIPLGGRYGLCLHELSFLSKDDEDPAPVEIKHADRFAGSIADKAVITVSSIGSGSESALVDGRVDGYFNHPAAEWASKGETAGAWVKLQWDKEQRIDRVTLFDRPYKDQVVSGLLIFSDGSFIHVDQPLPDSAKEGIEVKFKSKNVEWVKFIVLKTSDETGNVGLSEIAVFEAK